MKYLLLLAFLAAVWWVWSKRQVGERRDAQQRPEAPSEKMVICANCGVHLPESEGLAGGGQLYCCEAHRVAGSSKAP
ncbi:PP0621 family protein [Dechloromonas sp. HYN0024]|uniref:PP0621 family protein n=1 Tax=Dechloromonas sp. HYN0024 TaxID=2231055 RepID=UPI000E434D03|nr:PP0621 family protein [Dechloromonas sp. HYN0024]AXS79110.1 hypothetical protein HYN24_03105 [Dechloromonas sp. HYN0024]